MPKARVLTDEQRRENKRALTQRWREAHRDEVNEYQRNYRAARKAEAEKAAKKAKRK